MTGYLLPDRLSELATPPGVHCVPATPASRATIAMKPPPRVMFCKCGATFILNWEARSSL